jgi:HK97 family phage prohead protease
MTKSVHLQRLENRVTRTAARLVEHAEQRRLTAAELASTKLPWYAVRNLADPDQPADVFVFDEIGGSFGVSAKQFAEDLQAIEAPTINVRINSPGGSVFDAIAIYNALNHHPARIVTYVDALAASAASVIAMAGDEIVMMPGSQMMIHDASAVHDGNAADMAKMGTFLDRQSNNIADLYRMRAGGDIAEWRDLMLAETWMFASEAVDAGLADRVQEAPKPADPELVDKMARTFDLGQYRYAGRRAAPGPAQRRAARTGRSVAVVENELQRAARLRGTESRTPGGSARVAAFPAQLRAELVDHNGQQRYYVSGHASVVNTPYEMWDAFGPYTEVIDGGAFTRTLAAGPDVAFLTNHRGVTMARTTNDSLKLRMDGVGLAVEAWLNPKRVDVSDLVTAIQDRDVTEMSFAFMLGDDGGEWSPDMQTFRIKDLDLNRGDVSAVNYGANPYTDVAARSREILADLDHLPAGAARAALARLQHRGDLAPAPVRAPEPVPSGTSVAELNELVNSGRQVSYIEALLHL